MAVASNKLPHYREIHKWVEKQLGKPKHCVSCGDTNPSRRYHWANISKNYLRELSDWRRLCPSCNMLENPKRKSPMLKSHCKQGHEYTQENTYIRTKNEKTWRACRQCRLDESNRSNRRKREAYADTDKS